MNPSGSDSTETQLTLSRLLVLSYWFSNSFIAAVTSTKQFAPRVTASSFSWRRGAKGRKHGGTPMRAPVAQFLGLARLKFVPLSLRHSALLHFPGAFTFYVVAIEMFVFIYVRKARVWDDQLPVSPRLGLTAWH